MTQNAQSGLRLRAALFDMDGVVTDTARAHAAAWKRLFDEHLRRRADRLHEQFKPFDPRGDYREYVDGKPRGDGIRSFLESRGIELPTGDMDDGPDEETVCGLGNRKDRYFHEWLEANPVRAYPGTLRLLEDFRAAGIPSAVFSSSRNAEAVLRSAGVLERFDARVDGEDRAQLDIPGKPAPDMLLEAARRLGAKSGDCVVFEDAIAGIEAAVGGDFGLAVGVARDDGEAALKEAGAEIVVNDLSELHFDPETGLTVKTLTNLPMAWDGRDRIKRSLGGRTPAAFLDYDGTLTPIVEDPDRALLDASMRATLKALARACPVVIVSGRDLARLRELVGLDGVWYAGSHGFEIVGPGGKQQGLTMGEEFLPELDKAEQTLEERLAGIEGHTLERKRFSIAVHYRRVAEEEVSRVESVVQEVLEAHPGLYRGTGKKVFELRPDIDWDKGRAVLWLLERFNADAGGAQECVPIYIGDDITDEDAFHVLAGSGLCVAVRGEEIRRTAADYTLADTGEVERFLRWLTGIAGGSEANEEGGQ
ncbi:trehalose-phosphatase [Thioalkalivibrio denitrificans]|uniref:Trehalose 6-phosphate phosphatase n=1 Tax=Thioalkalivibrio denitrificans TaxID=108003 RepID=A0A1V3NSS8_9GAMM|nr:trehalose-phosphatase [Thioalkalivibrio denitrificans]